MLKNFEQESVYKINGNANKKLSGNISCFGGKNIAVKALITALLSPHTTTTLTNMPNIGDINTSLELLHSLGVKCTINNHTITIDPSSLSNISNLNHTNRTSISLFGILIHFFNYVKLPIIDGCNLGKRSVDFHVHIYEKFGLEIKMHPTYYEMFKHGDNDTKLKGQIISLPYASIGATETALFLSVRAHGRSVIHNIATEPEIMELISMLQMMGCKICFLDKNTIEIFGVDDLHGTIFDIMPDRLEVASWAVLAALSNGQISVTGCKTNYLHTFLGYFQQIGGGVEYINSNALTFFKKHDLTYTNLSTNVYPNLATDQLAQLATMLATANGISTLHETVYENRIHAIHEMLNSFSVSSTEYVQCLGTPCRFENHNHIHSLAIAGTKNIIAPTHGVVLPKNIRCAHSYMLLATQAKGTSILIDPSNSVIRGYGYDLVTKMQSIGVDITITNNQIAN